METFKRTPLQLFNMPLHFTIPLFQRPYVWDEDEQWEPLWRDVRRTAELRLEQPHLDAKHFLGAVVLQAQEGSAGVLSAWNVVDGQQRLTTLQLLMDATSAVLDDAGQDRLARRLDKLTHNSEDYVSEEEGRLKIRHSNKDRAAYDEVMSAEVPVDYDNLKHVESKLVRAHRYFAGVVERWLGDPDTEEFVDRAEALVNVLQVDLQLVSIDLLATENSQEIFETLNARGTPLTAADLIRNYVFQRLEAEDADTLKAYQQDWPFEAKFWEKEVSVGRYLVGRSSLFLNQWLVARTGEEISPQSTFTRFKQYVEHGGLKMSGLLPVIKQQADLYEAWTRAADDRSRQLDRVEMAVYRMRANATELLKPILIWLHEPGRDLPTSTIDEVVEVCESWVMRRLLLRLTLSDLARVVAEIVSQHSDAPADQLVERVRNQLTELNVASTYWPGDNELRRSLADLPAFRRYRRARLRMVLEAVEDAYRAETQQSQVERDVLPIEHVLPRSWEDHWPVDTPEAQEARAVRVHRLGNLTLLTTSINSKVRNSEWSKKRQEFLKHNTINMTGRLVMEHEHVWDEELIDARTHELIDRILQIWPVPEGHKGEVADPQAKAPAWIELKHLIAAGLLEPGTVLTPGPGKWESAQAVVTADGSLEVDGKRFDSPSAAGGHVRERHSSAGTNGWHFWRLPDGRKLKELRAEYKGEKPGPAADTYDWGPLHQILEALPEGSWTSYGDLAEAVGTAPQPLGGHVADCGQCANAYRILKGGGRVSPAFKWADPDDERDPVAVLESEGLTFTDGRADPERRLSSDDLQALVED